MAKIRAMGIFILCLLLFPGAVFAEGQKQAPLQMDELVIQVLPEYTYHPKEDKKEGPPLLIGYHGSLRNTTDEAQKGQIRIPVPVHEKNFKIGFIGDYSGDLSEVYPIEYELDLENGFITWETSEEIEPQGTYKFVVEYYTNTIEESEDGKSFDFHFKAFTDIGLLRVVVTEPLKTEKFSLEPAADSHLENSYGMNMFVYMHHDVKAGDEKNVHIRYEREEKRTTEEMFMAMAEYGAKQGERENDEIMPLWQIVLITGGMALAGAAVLIIFLKRKRNAKHGENPQAQQPPSGEAAEKTEAKIAALRSMLLAGDITEEEYREMMKKIGGA